MIITNGIIPINKPIGWTSFDVVNKIKHLLHTTSVGHLGTLDPMATGVLLVTVGKATKLFDLMQSKTKTYIAEFEFGYKTDTLDSTGQITEKTDIIPLKNDILRVLPNFVGKIMQLPPKYSAKSINGRRAYDLAREGKEFELEPKRVEINKIELISYDKNVLKLSINCGSGTYIRSIGRDISASLHSLATMISLVRTDVGNVNISNCFDITNVDEKNIKNYVYPIENFLDLPILALNEDLINRLLNGQTLILNKSDGMYFIKQNDEIVAIINIENSHAKMKIYLKFVYN